VGLEGRALAESGDPGVRATSGLAAASGTVGRAISGLAATSGTAGRAIPELAARIETVVSGDCVGQRRGMGRKRGIGPIAGGEEAASSSVRADATLDRVEQLSQLGLGQADEALLGAQSGEALLGAQAGEAFLAR